MKTRLSLRAGLALLLAASFANGSSVFAAETPAAVAADSAAAVAAYPLTTCAVSGDKLEAGDMGPIIDYIHKEEGKPDRLVRLCCKGCIKTFKKDPAKYLKMIDDAAKPKSDASADGHAGHNH